MDISIFFSGFESLPPQVELVRQADANGFHGVWSAEHVGFRDAIVPSAAYLAVTSEMQIGLVGMSSVTRHPGMLAMALAGLNDLAPGRVRAAIGTGSLSMLDFVGQTVERPIDKSIGFIDALRDVLSGESITADYYEGASFRDFDLFEAPSGGARVGIDLMAIRPKMVQTAARHADGINLSVWGTRPYIRSVVASVEKELQAIGKPRSEFRITALARAAIGTPEVIDQGIENCLPILVDRLSPSSLEVLAVGVLEPGQWDHLRDTGGRDALVGFFTPEVMRQLCLITSPEDLEEDLAEFAATGIDEVALQFLGPPPQKVAMMELLGNARTSTVGA